MQFRMRLAVMAVAGSAASLMLVGGPAVASTHATHPSTTGREVVRDHGNETYNQGTKKDQLLPVHLRGVVKTHGVIDLGGADSARAIRTPDGKFVVKSTHQKVRTKVLNPATCHLQVTVKDKITVVGNSSTGSFSGASGNGNVRVTFKFFFPKANGKCNYKAGALKHGGRVSFLLVIPALTVM
jgi:hypothetical protein